jgi:acyl-coenzyme A thioesterase PaaI-like protein
MSYDNNASKKWRSQKFAKEIEVPTEQVGSIKTIASFTNNELKFVRLGVISGGCAFTQADQRQ